MTIFESMILTAFEVLFYIVIVEQLLDKKIKTNKKFAAITAGAVLIGFVSEYFTEPFGTLFSAALTMGLIYMLYKAKPGKTVIVYLTSTVIIAVIQLIALIPLKLLTGNIAYDFYNGLLSQIISLVLICTVCRFIPLNHIMYFIDRKDRIFTYVTANAFVIIILIIVYWKIDMTDIVENLISVSILSFVLVVVNLVIIRKGLENSKAEEMLEMHEKYMPVYKQLVETIRRKQHDFNNHMNAVNMIVETSSDIYEIHSRIKKYTGEISPGLPLELIKLENTIVAGFLYSKTVEAESRAFNLELDIKSNTLSNVLMDSQWVEVLGILIDNAMEASNVENCILLSMEKKDMDIVTVRNCHPYIEKNDVEKYFEKGFSTKEDNRGYGLYNLKKILQGCNGTIEFFNEKMNNTNYVVFRVGIPM